MDLGENIYRDLSPGVFWLHSYSFESGCNSLVHASVNEVNDFKSIDIIHL